MFFCSVCLSMLTYVCMCRRFWTSLPSTSSFVKITSCQNNTKQIGNFLRFAARRNMKT